MNNQAWNIAIYGAGWVHNMGNSFIQLGSKAALDRALPGANIRITDGNLTEPPIPFKHRLAAKVGRSLALRALTRWESDRKQKAESCETKIVSLASLDAMVISGMWLSPKHLSYRLKEFVEIRERGIPIICNGVGGSLYDEAEISAMRKLLAEIRPFALITRDVRAYEYYKDLAPLSFVGMDMGFFVNEALPKPFPLKRKTVYCFDRGPVPSHLPMHDGVLLAHHSVGGMRFNPYTHPTFMSEMAEDYINLYAQCDVVYTDRVHACVAALAYGNKAQLIDETPRVALFDRVGAADIQKEPLSVSKEKLESAKNAHLSVLSEVFNALAAEKKIS